MKLALKKAINKRNKAILSYVISDLYELRDKNIQYCLNLNEIKYQVFLSWNSYYKKKWYRKVEDFLLTNFNENHKLIRNEIDDISLTALLYLILNIDIIDCLEAVYFMKDKSIDSVIDINTVITVFTNLYRRINKIEIL